MLERSISALLSHGFRDIIVTIYKREKALVSFARKHAIPLARAGGAKLRIFLERQPLGTIGAAGAIRRGARNLLIVNVDNLTCLDLKAFVAHHETTRAVMTIATHAEPVQVPFGRVSVRKGEVTAYLEKPQTRILVSSGAYVLSPEARRRIPRGGFGAPELVNILLRENQKISAFQHTSHWIDVNDSTSLQRAEELVLANFRCFELWRQPPDREVVVLGILKGLLLAVPVADRGRRPVGGAALPTEEVAGGKADPSETALRIRDRIGLVATQPKLFASFDEMNPRTGERTRYHLLLSRFLAPMKSKRPVMTQSVRWLKVNELSNLNGNPRAISYFKRSIESLNLHRGSH